MCWLRRANPGASAPACLRFSLDIWGCRHGSALQPRFCSLNKLQSP